MGYRLRIDKIDEPSQFTRKQETIMWKLIIRHTRMYTPKVNMCTPWISYSICKYMCTINCYSSAVFLFWNKKNKMPKKWKIKHNTTQHTDINNDLRWWVTQHKLPKNKERMNENQKKTCSGCMSIQNVNR